MRLPIVPPRSPKHTEERLKLSANILQNFALALFFSVLIAPLLNPALSAPLALRLLAILVSGIAVALAFLLLRYRPVPVPKELPHG